MKFKYILVSILGLVCCTGCSGVRLENHSAESSVEQMSESVETESTELTTTKSAETTSTQTVRIRIVVNGQTFTATMQSNATAQSFCRMLPLTLKMRDVNANEKYVALHTDIRNDKTIIPDNIESGDIMCYGDNGLVLFYESFPTTYQYVPIGKLDDATGLKSVLGTGDVTIVIENDAK